MTLAELQRILRAADSAAVLVAPRILERVVQEVNQLTGLMWEVPHRKSYVVDRHVLFRYVEQDDLNLEADHLLPNRVILLAKPLAEDFTPQESALLLLTYWRRLFHATIHLVLEERCAQGLLTLADIRTRMDQIGQTEFDEIRTVLLQDHYLPKNATLRDVYIEFVAVYYELKYFSANLLPVNFPALRDLPLVERLLGQDIEIEALLRRTRLDGAPDPIVRTDQGAFEAHEYYWRLVRSADRAAQTGNTVKAAILRTKAARVAPPALSAGTRADAEAELERLTLRLQGPLQLTNDECEQILMDLRKLLDKADQGHSPVEAAVLHDLQNVCLDHEREIYALDLVEWMLSAGKRPIKRPLPSQRLVRVTRHLHSAVQRLTLVRLTDADRQHLSGLLQNVLQQTEERLRARFRPVLSAVLEDVGMAPQNPPERTAFHKTIEELLDRVVDFGYFTFSDLRDVISRNQLKLPDLTGPDEFIRGDPLLQLDRRLGTLLDGVYRPSELYMRMLERLTALNFGTHLGRVLTNYVTIPFGAAFFVLEVLKLILRKTVQIESPWITLGPEQLDELRKTAAEQATPLPFILAPWISWAAFGLIGCLFFVLLHNRELRQRFAVLGHQVYRPLRRVCYELPLKLFNIKELHEFLASWPVQLIHWFVLKPVVICVVIWLIQPAWLATRVHWLIAFLLSSALLNSRPGHAIAETVTQSLISFYELLRGGLILGTIQFILWLFKRIADWMDYVFFLVDEWLRFRGGDTYASMVVRTLLGVVWFPISYFARFYTIVLLEPGLNPIKFPICSIGAKFIYPFWFVIYDFLVPNVPVEERGAMYVLWAGFVNVTIWFLPDVFGFLVWETKENWSLYRANRPTQMRPVVVASHGENVRRLLQRGIHSGTVPKLYTRLRRAERAAQKSGNWRSVRAHREHLSAVAESIKRFVARDLIAQVHQSASWQTQPLRVGRVELASNRIRLELLHAAAPQQPVVIELESRYRWLLARVREPGWLLTQPREALAVFLASLTCLYRLADVDLVQEQVRAQLPAEVSSFEVTPTGLLLWVDRQNGPAIRYDLREYSERFPALTPEGAPIADWPVLEARQLIFRRVPLGWEEWVAAWQDEYTGQGPLRLLGNRINLNGLLTAAENGTA